MTNDANLTPVRPDWVWRQDTDGVWREFYIGDDIRFRQFRLPDHLEGSND